MLALYIAPGSSSMAPHIALNEAGAEFELRPLSFHKQEQRQQSYLAINPEGKVPVLIDGDLVLTEVAAILFYIARRFPDAGLLPVGLAGEARALAWMSFLASTVHPAGRAGNPGAPDAYMQAERRLDGREWALDGKMSVVDIHLFRLFWRNHPRFGFSRESYPGLWSLHDRMMARPAVQRTCAAESAIGYELKP